MAKKHVEPQLGLESFNCPHCGAMSHQFWFNIFINRLDKGKLPRAYKYEEARMKKVIAEYEANGDDAEELKAFAARAKKHTVFHQKNSMYADFELLNVATSRCFSCDGYSLWLQDKLLYPAHSSRIEAHEDLPEDIKSEFQEAALILDLSPRGAAALLRLAIQKLMPILDVHEKDINKAIGTLVQRGLDQKVQRALDIVRVIGNNAVHPGRIDLTDDRATALQLFKLVNVIVEAMISTPKNIAEMYEALPEGARSAIEKRDEPRLLTNESGE